MSGFLHGASRVLNGVFLAVAGTFILLMMVHVTADVVLRNLGYHIQGTLEIVGFYYMVCLVMLPMGYVELKREHIRVDLFAQMLPGWLQLGLYVLACLLGLVFFGMLGWQMLADAQRAMRVAETAMANFTFYIWPARWAMPLGFAGLLLAILSNLLRALAERRAL